MRNIRDQLYTGYVGSVNSIFEVLYHGREHNAFEVVLYSAAHQFLNGTVVQLKKRSFVRSRSFCTLWHTDWNRTFYSPCSYCMTKADVTIIVVPVHGVVYRGPWPWRRFVPTKIFATNDENHGHHSMNVFATDEKAHGLWLKSDTHDCYPRHHRQYHSSRRVFCNNAVSFLFHSQSQPPQRPPWLNKLLPPPHPCVIRTASCTIQDTYDRLVLDQLAITVLEGRDLPFRNLWSDRIWRGTVEVSCMCIYASGCFFFWHMLG